MPKKQFNSNVYFNPNTAFANQNVIVTLKKSGNNEHIISGKLIKIENPDDPYAVPAVIAVQDNVSKQMTYISTSDIAAIRAAQADMMNETVPADCWVFNRKNTDSAQAFEFSYLSSGIVWQSAVELHLVSANKMNIIHNAIIRNNGKKFDCPDFFLVSGTPEISTANIISLLCSPDTAKRKAFPVHAARVKSPMPTSNAMMLADSASPITFISQSSDIFYRSLGAVAMDENESRRVKLQSAENIPYRTVAKWDIPASRNTYGRVIGNTDRNKADNTLIFKNLCPAMLDAAPVAIYVDGKLMMITSLADNTPVNAERSLRLSSADGIECRITENEIVKNREQNIIFNNRRYVKCTVEATLKVTNHRKISSPIVIDYNFNGEFAECSHKDGKLTQNAVGTSLLNPASELHFDFTLAPSASKEIKVTYTVLTAL